MSAILNSLNAHFLLIFQPILMIPVSKFMVYRALSDKPYLSLGLLSPLKSFSNIARPLHNEAVHDCSFLYTIAKKSVIMSEAFLVDVST